MESRFKVGDKVVIIKCIHKSMIGAECVVDTVFYYDVYTSPPRYGIWVRNSNFSAEVYEDDLTLATELSKAIFLD